LEILTGFGKGDFLIPGEGGEVQLDPERYPDWKEQVAKHAADLVSYLAQQIFEGLRVVPREEQ
jgi:hypothetical protein